MIFKNRKFLVWTGLALSLFFLYLSVKGIDLAEVGQALSQANIWLVIPLLFLYGLFFWMRSIRWRMLLSPIRSLTVKDVFPAVMIGTMSNNILPIHMGELVRMYVLSQQHRLKKTSVLATLVLERIFDFLSVILLLNLAFWIGENRPPTLVKAGYAVGALSVIMLILTVAFVYKTRNFVIFFRRITTSLPDGMRSWFLKQIEAGAEGLNAVKRADLLPGIVATSIAQWVFISMSQYLALLALDIRVPFTATFVILAFTVIGITLPTAPGFFGTIEYCIILALAPYGISASQAFPAAIFYHLINYVSSTLVGLYFARSVGYSIARIRRVAGAGPENAAWQWSSDTPNTKENAINTSPIKSMKPSAEKDRPDEPRNN